MPNMPDVNYLAVALAALSAFLLGGLWYSPALFAKKWMAYTGHGDCDGKEQANKGNMGLIFGGAFLLNLISAWVLAMFLKGVPDIAHGAGLGLVAGLCWVATSLGVTYLFERRPLGLWLINGGYQALQFALMGAIIAAMG